MNRRVNSRAAMLAEMRACARDLNWRVWSGADRVFSRKENRYVMTEVFKFYSGTGLVATCAGLPAALRKVRSVCIKMSESRNQKKLPGVPRIDNPVPPSSRASGSLKNRRLTNDIETAKNLYNRFSGHDAREIARIKKPEMPDALVVVGECAGILYDTVRDGVKEKYIHKFHAASRPLFCVSPDGKVLCLLGGAFTFTERGIVDTDLQGREIE